MLITITVNLPREFCLHLAKDHGLEYPLREVDARRIISGVIRAGLGLQAIDYTDSEETTSAHSEAHHRERE